MADPAQAATCLGAGPAVGLLALRDLAAAHAVFHGYLELAVEALWLIEGRRA